MYARIETYLRVRWRYLLLALTCGTGYLLDWLEELHGNLIAAVDELDSPVNEEEG